MIKPISRFMESPVVAAKEAGNYQTSAALPASMRVRKGPIVQQKTQSKQHTAAAEVAAPRQQMSTLVCNGKEERKVVHKEHRGDEVHCIVMGHTSGIRARGTAREASYTKLLAQVGGGHKTACGSLQKLSSRGRGIGESRHRKKETIQGVVTRRGHSIEG